MSATTPRCFWQWFCGVRRKRPPLKEGLRLEPRSAKLHNTFAILYAERGRFAGARAHWQHALEIEPRYEEARRNLQRLDQMGP